MTALSPMPSSTGDALLPCPFCNGAMLVREHTAFHPQNDCWLSGKEICDFDYMSWNRRALPPPAGDAPDYVLVPREPTENQLWTGGRTIVDRRVGLKPAELAALVYREMIAAAPRAAGTDEIVAERDAAVSMLRIMGEELVLAGYPAGDRNVQLANLRKALAAPRAVQAGDAPDLGARGLTERQAATIERLTAECMVDFDGAAKRLRDYLAKLTAPAAPRAAGTGEVERALKLAAIRLSICADRMRGCNSEGGKHELIDEVNDWADDAQRALTAALSLRAATVEQCARVVEAPGPLEGYEHFSQNTRAMIRSIRDQLAAAIRRLAPSASTEKGNG